MLDLESPLTKHLDRQRLSEFMEHEKEQAHLTGSRLNLALSSILNWLVHKQAATSFLGLGTTDFGRGLYRCKRLLRLSGFVAGGFPRPAWDFLIIGTYLRWSASRWLAASGREVNCVTLREESVNAFVSWPLITSLAIAAILLVFTKSGLPVLLWSSASGAVLSVAGGLVCAAVLSIRACGAAGVVLGTAFGVVHGLIVVSNGGIGGIAKVVARNDSFTRVVGGLVAVDAPRYLGSSLSWTLVALGLPAIGIACAAKLMARPLEAANEKPAGIWRETMGALLGSSVGAGIFILMKSTELLSRLVAGRSAFLIGYASAQVLVALACLFRLRVASTMRVTAFALVFLVFREFIGDCHVVVAGRLAVVAGKFGRHGMFHAVFFTCRRGQSDTGLPGWRAGAAAAILEGVGGYVGFALSRAF